MRQILHRTDRQLRRRLMAMALSERDAEVPMEETRGRCGVRRNLFGPVDHQQLEQEFQRLLCMTVDTATRRWDFDFLSDRPSPGSTLQWEELRCQDVPAFYHSRVVKRAGSGRWRSEVGTSSSSSSTSSSSSSSPTHSSSEGNASPPLWNSRAMKRSFSALSVAMAPKHKQATITDFFTVRKRRRLHHKSMSRQ
ncbi:cyclin-dependent kinase inhibitor 1D isoform X2 [Alosa alosa]|uniref:cyclin-dependent kinase inhibitor 1D isoform X2 n=1 Tax=Alosa sapidissima TaxID=34773 RepID=UPI001C08C31F|nr:cyclin-dependent kinase inhibitor 1D isoform X2 [Alosa sapidissima]XP_048123543.1 cyclin-dependent kinase inhibitor 1D isoform X2 [Alosa alosa]